jgi:stage II sporulation protein P
LRRYNRRKIRSGAAPHHAAFKKIIVPFVIFLAVWSVTFLKADAAAENFLYNLVQNSETVNSILNFEFNKKDGDRSSLDAIFAESSLLGAAEEMIGRGVPDDIPEELETVTEQPLPESPKPVDTEPPEETPSGIQVDFSGYLSADALQVSNSTEYSIDYGALLNSRPNFVLPDIEPAVLIVHTHGSEAYTKTENDTYEETEYARTEDKDHNVIRVGRELAEVLGGHGISVLHDESIFDYPSYTGSYSRSLDCVSLYLEAYPSIKVVIDLHRDGLFNSDGSAYRTVATVGESECAQVMLIMGSDFSGLEHSDWQENLKFALRLQYSMDQLYPSLARPLCVSQYRYNQHLTTGSLILEVGSNGNTLDEALGAVRYFGEAAANVLKDLSE